MRRAQMSFYPCMRRGTALKDSALRGACLLSLHAQGNRSALRARVDVLPTIPACAGEPAHLRSPPGLSLFYPCMRRGTGTSAQPAREHFLLSLHAQGNPARVLKASNLLSFIPACAGEPKKLLEVPTVFPFYPCMRRGTEHGCGIPSPNILLSLHAQGNRQDPRRRLGCPGLLSLHAQGNLEDAGTHCAAFPSIPACAGEPSTWVSLCSR